MLLGHKRSEKIQWGLIARDLAPAVKILFQQCNVIRHIWGVCRKVLFQKCKNVITVILLRLPPLITDDISDQPEIPQKLIVRNQIVWASIPAAAILPEQVRPVLVNLGNDTF